MLTTPKWLGLLAVAFVAGSFIASPELGAFAANTIGSADIINESILSVDIKNGEVKTDDIAPSAVGSLRIKDNDVKAQDIAPDSVGGSELQGVSKLLFGQCAAGSGPGTLTLSPGGGTEIACSISGVDSDDSAIAQPQVGGGCFDARASKTDTNKVYVYVFNQCAIPHQFGTGTQLAVVVFDK